MMRRSYGFRKLFVGFGLWVAACVLVPGMVSGAEAQTATKKHHSTTTASKSPTHKSSISQNPYLGAIVEDAATGRVLIEDHADAKGYPASVLKLMDLLIILEKIEAKQLS